MESTYFNDDIGAATENVGPGPNSDSTSREINSDNAPQAPGNILPIAIMGHTGTGKTSFINLVSGSNFAVGDDLDSCTSMIQAAPIFQLDGHSILLFDNPGFDDTSRSDTEILTQIAAFLATTYQKGMKLAGIIYLHRISDVRVGGISARNIRMFEELCGPSPLKNIAIVTTMWGPGIKPEVGERREKQLANDDRFFKFALDNGAHLLRHVDEADVGSAQAIIRSLFQNQPEAMRIQEELVDEGKDISQTAAGEVLNREFAAKLKLAEENLRRDMKGLEDRLRKSVEADKTAINRQLSDVQQRYDETRQIYRDPWRSSGEVFRSVSNLVGNDNVMDVMERQTFLFFALTYPV